MTERFWRALRPLSLVLFSLSLAAPLYAQSALTPEGWVKGDKAPGAHQSWLHGPTLSHVEVERLDIPQALLGDYAARMLSLLKEQGVAPTGEASQVALADGTPATVYALEQTRQDRAFTVLVVHVRRNGAQWQLTAMGLPEGDYDPQSLQRDVLALAEQL
jgi:hypothetical protein